MVCHELAFEVESWGIDYADFFPEYHASREKIQTRIIDCKSIIALISNG